MQIKSLRSCVVNSYSLSCWSHVNVQGELQTLMVREKVLFTDPSSILIHLQYAEKLGVIQLSAKAGMPIFGRKCDGKNRNEKSILMV